MFVDFGTILVWVQNLLSNIEHKFTFSRVLWLTYKICIRCISQMILRRYRVTEGLNNLGLLAS